MGQQQKSLFENVSLGVLGVVTLDHKGNPKGVAVPYKGQIWLSEDEQVLTANAPRNESDNPFLPGKEKLKLIRKSADLAHVRPIGEHQDEAPPAAPAEEQGSVTAEPPAGEAPAGVNTPNPPTTEQEAPVAPPAPPASSPSAGAEPVVPKPGPLAAGNPGGDSAEATAAVAKTPPPAPKQAAKAPPAQPKAPAE